MTVQKNFIINNGIEVNTNLIFGDTGSNKVGIATTNALYTLHVNGGTGAINSTVTGISTINNLVVNGTLKANASTGSTGNYLVSTGVGVTWIPPRISTVFTATVGQTIFNTKYTVGYVDVYVNGIRLVPNEFTATDGQSVTLNDACFGDEVVELVVYSTL